MGADAIADDQPRLPVIIAVVGHHQAVEKPLVIVRLGNGAAAEYLGRIVEAAVLPQVVHLDAVYQKVAELVVHGVGRARDDIAGPGPVAL